MKRYIFSALTALLFAVTSMAAEQQDFELKLWPEGAPTKNGLEGQPEELQRGGARIANVSAPTLHVYPAAKPNGKAIICCPGGGYYCLAVKNEGTEMVKWMNKQGVTFCVLKYRMPNGHKEVPLEDARRAIEIVRDSASVWDVNPDQVGIMGCSAGGHLAASLATMYGDKKFRPDFQILLYPVISMNRTTHKNSAKNLIGENPSESDVEMYTLQNRVTAETPRAFLALSCDDKTVDPVNSMDYVDALLRCRVPVTLHMYPSGGHGWGYKESFAFKRNWTDELETWLRTF